jgi:hypothetical protein
MVELQYQKDMSSWCQSSRDSRLARLPQVDCGELSDIVSGGGSWLLIARVLCENGIPLRRHTSVDLDFGPDCVRDSVRSE